MENPMIRMQEQADDANAEYSDWVDANEENLLMWWTESLDTEDLPEQIKAELPTDDVDMWEMALENHVSRLTFEDVPDSYMEMQYELHMGGDEE